MELKQWKSKGKYFSYKERYKIFYRYSSYNDSETVLLLHGFPTSSWDWHKLWEILYPKLNLICLDFIGFGYSDKPNDYNYSLFDQADLVEELLTKLNINSINILAHDYGDTVAQELMARSLEKKLQVEIKTICLLNGGIYQDGNNPRPIQKLLASPIGKLLAPFLNKTLLRRNFNKIFGPNTQASEIELNNFYELIELNGGKYRIPQIIRYLHERVYNQERWEDTLRNFPNPLLLINGIKDPISGKGIVETARREAPKMQIVELNDIGHYPQIEAPKLVSSNYLEFLNSIDE